ncbi:protein kinase domain-containing protein [Roseivivax marinus]|uniref:protein kinase domain-containing protein n=1 Tax=Roseivivax marinus TaxID=1379903 RepID=UPI00273DBDAF|nr:protein kinase [Roseivivax marinus]
MTGGRDGQDNDRTRLGPRPGPETRDGDASDRATPRDEGRTNLATTPDERAPAERATRGTDAENPGEEQEGTRFAPLPPPGGDAEGSDDARPLSDPSSGVSGAEDDTTRVLPGSGYADPDRPEDYEGTRYDPRIVGAPADPEGPERDGTRYAEPLPSAGAPPASDTGTHASDPAAGAAPSVDDTRRAPLEAGAEDEEATAVGPPPAIPRPRAGGAGASPIAVGTLVNNNYEIVEVVKAGGMGEVFRGIEIGTGDPVALKAILPELAEDEKAGLLFKREARTLRQLADDAIVRYYNYVHDHALDRYFLVMEFVDGVTLSDHLKAHGPISTNAARALLRRLARGLSKAHERDVIHRDLSPDNVMLPGGSVADAVLIDFGIAKSNVVTEGTMRGQFAGKFKYVAPEQLGHHRGAIGPWTDIYGLALMLCAAVLGRPLDMGSSVVDAVESRRTIPDLGSIPGALRPLLSYMLEPAPGDRPASMAEVERMIDAPDSVPTRYGGGVTQAETRPPWEAPLATPTTTRGPQGPRAISPVPIPLAGAEGAPTLAEPRRGGPRYALAILSLVVLGGAGWFAWSTGLFEEGAAPPGAGQEAAGDGDGAAGLGAPDTTTREGFLATWDGGDCTLATRIAAGANTGLIAGYAGPGRTQAFSGLSGAYEERFGAAPEILARNVTEAQCPVLDFAGSVQGRGGDTVRLALDAEQVASGGAVTAQVDVPDGRSVWVALVSAAGGVYNLTGRLSEPVGGARSLSFGLNLSENAEAAPQLVVAVATETPLAAAAAAQDGTRAEVLFARILDEITSGPGEVGADLGHVLLLPPGGTDETSDGGD